jgi:hypothetical protein
MTPRLRTLSARVRSQAGFTMIVALGVMLVTSLLLVIAFTAAEGEIFSTRTDATQKQAYYAALAGVQEYEYKLQANPNYWQTCEGPKSTIQEGNTEKYEVTVLVASTGKGFTECSTASPFKSVIESEGALANTFRIKSTGFAGSEKRSLIATFQVTGFLDYVYFTNFETLDPKLYSSAGCENKYYIEWNKEGKKCQVIEFTTGDAVNGPMHTNDSTDVGGAASFGREGHVPADTVQINGGTYGGASGCSSSAKYYTATKCYVKGEKLVPPESDSSLAAYVESSNEFEGATYLVLNGSTNTIGVTRYIEKAGKAEQVKETIAWPANGLLYVRAAGSGKPALSCSYKFEIENSDNSTETENEKGCGNVYVSGSYSKSLTVAGERELIINGNVYPKSVEGSLGSEPTGTSTLGLIASEYVRVYHPCSGGKNGAGFLENPWIYAALLSTSHSFIVDNYGCGAEMGKLHEYGAIAQNYRGAVGTGGGFGASTGYIKDYKYDDRLATDEPPYFLAPLKAGWKIIRETAPSAG